MAGGSRCGATTLRSGARTAAPCTSSGPQATRAARGTPATPEDERPRVLLLRATAWAEGELGRPLLAQVYSESVAAYGGRRLALSRYPLRAVLRLFDRTATWDAPA